MDGLGVDESNQIVGGPLLSSGRLPHADKYANPHISLGRVHGRQGTVWERIVAKHDLRPYTYPDIVSRGFSDAIFSAV